MQLKNISISATVFLAFLGSAALAESAQDNSKMAAGAVSSNSALVGLIDNYAAASDRVRPNIARQIARLERAETDQLIKARALLVLSQQAAVDQRKDLSLRTARDASALVMPMNDKVMIAKASVAITRALIMQEEHLAALENITKARRAYGVLLGELDPAWDELVMWEAIAAASLPPSQRERGQALRLNTSERVALTGERGARCGVTANGMLRIENVGLNPFGSALEAMANDRRGGVNQMLMAGEGNTIATEGSRNGIQAASMVTKSTGGIAVRSDIPVSGEVSRVVVTAYSPSQMFARAAEIAAPTWRYIVPSDLPASCRTNILTVLAFQLR